MQRKRTHKKKKKEKSPCRKKRKAIKKKKMKKEPSAEKIDRGRGETVRWELSIPAKNTQGKGRRGRGERRRPIKGKVVVGIILSKHLNADGKRKKSPKRGLSEKRKKNVLGAGEE